MRGKKAFTLTELVLALGVSGLVLSAVAAIWYMVTSRVGKEQRLQEVRKEIIMIMEQFQREAGYGAIGSKVPGHEGLWTDEVISTFPVGWPSDAVLGYRRDVNDTPGDPLDDTTVFYVFDNLAHTLSIDGGPVISRRVVDISARPVGRGSLEAGDFFVVNVSLTCRYDPGRPAEPSTNPELSVVFPVIAHKVSAR